MTNLIKRFRVRWTPLEQAVIGLFTVTLITFITGLALNSTSILLSACALLLACTMATFYIDTQRRVERIKGIERNIEEIQLVQEVEIYLLRESLGLNTREGDQPPLDEDT